MTKVTEDKQEKKLLEETGMNQNFEDPRKQLEEAEMADRQREGEIKEKRQKLKVSKQCIPIRKELHNKNITEPHCLYTQNG